MGWGGGGLGSGRIEHFGVGGLSEGWDVGWDVGGCGFWREGVEVGVEGERSC